MALNGDALGTAINNAIGGLSEADKLNPEKIWQAIAGAIVLHIQTNAQVNTSVAVASVSLVTPGIGASGPGVGTGTGTIL